MQKNKREDFFCYPELLSERQVTTQSFNLIDKENYIFEFMPVGAEFDSKGLQF